MRAVGPLSSVCRNARSAATAGAAVSTAAHASLAPASPSSPYGDVACTPPPHECSALRGSVTPPPIADVGPTVACARGKALASARAEGQFQAGRFRPRSEARTSRSFGVLDPPTKTPFDLSSCVSLMVRQSGGPAAVRRRLGEVAKPDKSAVSDGVEDQGAEEAFVGLRENRYVSFGSRLSRRSRLFLSADLETGGGTRLTQEGQEEAHRRALRATLTQHGL